ncbi:aminodeoxychorismate synthase, component I [Microbulbifer agarilyticus]|uniref:aminodeoxychorismate synthase n=1 Tax=Microbulbifer agarilyticus TaxID=260552 RepID=A0A1Q2M611_9GAMM|nr:aminodeoxychorismate synthase component I [Microbulbifer agarilyticus]AQQ67717.1 aminodeoxychorismate synthase, component I [Microbulbifer agarilyticus]
MQIISLPYSRNLGAAFTALGDLPCPVWLDSGQPRASGGRFDIISADPIASLTLNVDDSAPFAALDDLLCELEPQEVDQQIPFCGGAIGFAGYELGNNCNFLPPDTRPTPLPAGAFGLYSWALIADHQLGTTHLVFHPACTRHQKQDLQQRFEAIDWEKPAPGHESFKLTHPFQHEYDASEYARRIESILDYIRAGDIYQANFTQRFNATYEGDPLTAYLALREAAAGPFSAYLSLPEGQLLSLSPERFILADGRFLQTEPIKGTVPRGETPAEDAALAQQLRDSRKDRAENLMIVDLLRNDFGKVCERGSVRVPNLFELQSFANVHHLVSTINGQLPQDVEYADVLSACFPGGSITGAPKRRAMEVIRELEDSPRGAYCGSIGYLSSCGRADTNIAIRTLTTSNGKISCAAGGGIVADSDPAAEHRECLDKVRILLNTLEARFS